LHARWTRRFRQAQAKTGEHVLTSDRVEAHMPNSHTAGTVTAYDGNDPSCTPHVFAAGTAFVDPGGSHVHIIRNESTTDVVQTIAVQLLPAGQPRRIDVTPAPGDCPF
jgi:hypothetical protein